MAPLLDPSDVLMLARRYRKTNDRNLERRLVAAHLRLVWKIVSDYQVPSDARADLAQEGCLGLLHAVRRFDPDRGVRLSTYAAWWIRAAVLRALTRDFRLVRVGTNQRQRRMFFNLRRERERIEREGGTADAEQLGARFGVDAAEAAAFARHMAAPELSLDVDSPLAANLTAPEESQPDLEAERAEARDRVRGALRRLGPLSPREHAIVFERWLSEVPVTLDELGSRFGVSRERARQLEERLARRLRAHLTASLKIAA